MFFFKSKDGTVQDMRSWVRFPAVTLILARRGKGDCSGKVVYGEAPLRGSNPFPHVPFLTEKNLFSNTFHCKKVALSHTYFISLNKSLKKKASCLVIFV